MEKCECYIHSLKQGETHVLGEATILKRIGDNDYLAEYNGVKCHAIYLQSSQYLQRLSLDFQVSRYRVLSCCPGLLLLLHHNRRCQRMWL